VVAISGIQAGRRVTGHSFGQLVGQLAHRPTGRLRGHVDIFTISGEQPREMLEDGRLPRAARTVDADEQPESA
jgi:hypothetical protein